MRKEVKGGGRPEAKKVRKVDIEYPIQLTILAQLINLRKKLQNDFTE